MKRVALLFLLAGWLVPLASAQETEHFQFGVNADYLRLSQTDTNFAGVGARLGFLAFRNIKLEAELNYDFDQAVTDGFTSTSTGSVAIHRTGMRILHGEFGPKVNLGEHWHVHPFVQLHFSNRPATLGTFFNEVGNLRDDNVAGVLYPGGGLEGHLGPVGVRFDIADEIFFAHGTHNNLRISLGPYIRF